MTFKELFPTKHLTGFISSLVLTGVALLVLYLDVSMKTGVVILLITAFMQAGIQLVMFMHAGESEDGTAIYTHTYYAVFIALVTVLGTLLTMVWGYQ
ncbi:cytochrome aa3 quinol oxidase subunit IV [Aciduricibacillus chroicocephali]|uniref:Quinol oxidase subunit 4 n=1 Tax=Aciduricibacillus chroicocephali TaxID=3054939 RepID=A0ABY9KVX9_9BACI|nr:cytochrome aa3 quinol oxidase subunit IV [Bacillaceae bacterium 44XB]